MKLAIGLIMSHGFPTPAPFVQSILRLQQGILSGEFNTPDVSIDACRMIFSHAFPTDTARNEVCQLVLDQDTADALLFLDCDMTHPPDIAHRLLARQQPIVSGRYSMRKPPFFTVAMRKTGDGPNDYQSVDKVIDGPVKGLIPIDAAGAGALMIRRDVLEALRKALGDDWFRYQVGPDGQRSVSEDMWFYEQAKALGFPAYLDTTVECGHIGQFEIDSRWHDPFREAYQAKVAAS